MTKKVIHPHVHTMADAGAAPRQKSLRKRLQRQLEFYLSESNLRQDKFLQQNMDEHGYIPVHLLLTFNKCVVTWRDRFGLPIAFSALTIVTVVLRLKALKATERMVLEAAEKSVSIRVDRASASIAPAILPDADSSRAAGQA